MGSVVTIRLVTKGCPDPDCESNCASDCQSSQKLIYWNHVCGANAKLDRKGDIHCFNCDTSYSILNSKFKCSNCQNWYKPDHARLLLILGVLGTLKKDDYNSSVSSTFTHSEFIDFLADVVDNIKNK